MNTNALPEEIRSVLAATTTEVGNFIVAQKAAHHEVFEKTLELQGRLQNVEQHLDKIQRFDGVNSRVISSRSVASSGPFRSFSDDDQYAMDGGGLGASAEDLIIGMKGATSTRKSLPLSIKSISGISYDVPPQNLGPTGLIPLVARLLDLLPPRKVDSNSLTFTRVSSNQANSPPDNRAAKVAELALKPESSVTTEPVTIEIPTYAHWTEASKQILDDVSELQGILDGILRAGLLDVIDADIYATLTTVGNFTAFSPTASEGVGDAAARISSQIANAGGTGIVVAVNPLDYLAAQLSKATGSGIYLGMPPNLASRVVAIPAVTQGKILAFAPGSGPSWADREGINVQLGLTDNQFIRNAVSILCEARGAVIIRDPSHIAWGNVTG